MPWTSIPPRGGTRNTHSPLHATETGTKRRVSGLQIFICVLISERVTIQERFPRLLPYSHAVMSTTEAKKRQENQILDEKSKKTTDPDCNITFSYKNLNVFTWTNSTRIVKNTRRNRLFYFTNEVLTLRKIPVVSCKYAGFWNKCY